MSTTTLPFSARIRRSPFFARSHADGATTHTVYNHMLLPAWFRSPEEDYAHLRSAVQLWDTGGERQVEIVGPRVPALVEPWPLSDGGDAPAGRVSSAAWSPEQKRNVAIAMIARDYWVPGTRLQVQTPEWPREVLVQESFWERR